MSSPRTVGSLLRTHALLVRVMALLPPSPFPVGFGTMPWNTRGLSYAVPPSTYEDPTVESPVAFTSGNDLFIEDSLQGRIKSIDQLLRGMVRTTNVASPSLPIRQAMNCLLRFCTSRKCDHFLWAMPPDKAAKFSASIDEKLIAATEEIFEQEELGELQKELPFMPSFPTGEAGASAPSTTRRRSPTSPVWPPRPTPSNHHQGFRRASSRPKLPRISRRP